MVTYPVAVAGESFGNDDGSSRQEIIRRSRAGDVVELRLEPENRYDSNAVAVITKFGQIGYVGRDAAEWVADVIDRDKRISARIKAIGPGERSELLSVILEVTVGDAREPSSDLSERPPVADPHSADQTPIGCLIVVIAIFATIVLANLIRGLG